MKRRSALLALALFCAGCSIEIDPKDDAYARRFLAILQTGEPGAILGQLDESIDPLVARPQVDKMIETYGRLTPSSIEQIGYHGFSSGDDHRTDITYEVHTGDRWILANVAVGPKNGELRVRAANLYIMKESLKTANAFHFRNAGIKHFMFLTVCTLIPLFVLTTAVIAIRTKFPRRKWLWVAFILLGFFQISFNWTTGDVGMTPASFLLLGSAVSKAGPYAPWILSFGFPLGAVLFLRRRFKPPAPVVEA